MNVDIARGYDSFFGPPSEPISIQKFLHDAAALTFPSETDILSHVGWKNLAEDERAAVQAECSGSVAELKAIVEEAWNNPMLSAHLRRTHALAVSAVHTQGGPVPKIRKRKHLPDPKIVEAQPEVRELQQKLDAISLRCWGLDTESAFFMRTSKHSDFNALRNVKKSGHGTLACGRSHSQSAGTNPCSSPEPTQCLSHRDALVTLSVYNRVPWIHSQVTRFSQHILLSSQSLGDLVRVIPCDSNEIPAEVVDSQGSVVGYTYESEVGPGAEQGCLLLIEDVVYGDGRPDGDYADRLVSHVQGLPEEKRPQITKSSTSLRQTPFASLTLRISQPYWMLHQGNCEHFIVVDQIRLAHSLDPPSGYPLTVHATPTIGDVCKACAKVPAVLAVVGDLRLGESPCLLCAPCWRHIGPPREEDAERVMVVPLVRHQYTWDNGVDI